MSATALLLAAHGSRHESSVNAGIRALADDIAARGFFAETAVAFHQGEPAYSTVIDSLTADEIIVVPLLTSDGYYCDVVLPRELMKNRRMALNGEPDASTLAPAALVTVTQPVGMHSGMADLVARRTEVIRTRFAEVAGPASIAVVGHGTPRHPRSRNATVELAAKLQNRGLSDDAFAVFLDDEPPVESIVGHAKHQIIIVILFLIGAGPHATSDVPRRIGLRLPNEPLLPLMGEVEGKRVICDAPVGTDPSLTDLILDLASPGNLRTSALDDTRILTCLEARK